MQHRCYTRISVKISLPNCGTKTNGNYCRMMAYVITWCQLFRLCIAWNFQLSLPHLQRAPFFQSVVHSSVVTKWPRIVCINHSRGNFKEIMLAHRTKTPKRGSFPFYQYLSYNLLSNFEPECFLYILMVTFKLCYRNLWIFMLVLGSSLNDRKSSKDNANMGNYKANRGYLPYTVNHTSAICSVLTRTLISPYRDEAPSYWDVQRYVKHNISNVG